MQHRGDDRFAVTALGAEHPATEGAEPALVPPLALSTRSIHWYTATHESTNDAPSATIPISEPFFGKCFPKSRIRTNETAGIAGMIQP